MRRLTQGYTERLVAGWKLTVEAGGQGLRVVTIRPGFPSKAEIPRQAKKIGSNKDGNSRFPAPAHLVRLIPLGGLTAEQLVEIYRLMFLSLCTRLTNYKDLLYEKGDVSVKLAKHSQGLFMASFVETKGFCRMMTSRCDLRRKIPIATRRHILV